MKKTAIFPAALALAIALGCNTGGRDDANIRSDAENTGTGTADTVGTRGEEDNNREFLTRMMDANMAEIELGRMAQNQAASAEVKGFGQMMVADHTKALDSLKPIAGKTGTPMVAQMDEETRELRDRLARLQAAEFDREYMRAMVDAHENVADLLQTRANEDRFGENKGATTPEQADNAVSTEINQWAAKTLPTTRHHLEEARRINDGLGDRQTRR